MWESTKSLLHPPVVEDVDAALNSRVVHMITLALLASLMITISLHAVFEGDRFTIAILSGEEVFVFVAFWLNREGRHKQASILLSYSLLLTATLLLWTSNNGIHSTSILIYPSTLV